MDICVEYKCVHFIHETLWCLCPGIRDHKGPNSHAKSMSAVFTAYTFLHDETYVETSPNLFASIDGVPPLDG